MTDQDQRMDRARALLDVQPREAAEIADQLIAEGVDVPNAQLCRGLAMGNMGDLREAADYLVSIGTSPEFFVNAANFYSRLGLETEEIQALIRLLAFPNRDFENSMRRLGAWAIDNKQWDIARRALLAVFDKNSADIGVILGLANACRELRLYQQSITFHVRALDMLSDESSDQRASVHAALSGIYKDMGEQQKALYHFRRTYELSSSTNSASNLIMDMQYTHGVDLQQFYDQCREFSQRFLRMMPRFQYPLERLDPSRADQGLRVGFISGDFVAHSLTNLMLEPFRRFKSVSNHTIICYFTRETGDKWTEKYKSEVDLWRNVHGMNHLDRAKLIHEDQVDILIDLAGHTAHNALPTFGYKPAPVQMGWISGMMTPPAIETINYFFTDPYIRPKEADDICAEKLINLPSTCTYFPMEAPPDVASLPADRNGYITFGSFNNPCKISDQVIETWAKAMHAVRNSRIEIKIYSKDHERTLSTKLLKLGIIPDRVKFIYNIPSAKEVMRHITEKFDIVLDTWPCAGMLTSAEIMWLGVPIVTMAGGTFLHNQTHTLNCQCGLEDRLSAWTVDEFVQQAKDLAADREKLRELRTQLRSMMELAPVRNPEAVAKALMDGCSWAWKDWCESRAPLIRLQLYGDVARMIQ